MRLVYTAAMAAMLGAASVAQAGPTAFATTTAGNLISFDVAAPGTLLSTSTLSGLDAGESILGIDFRPATPGTLYAVGSGSSLYTINTGTGAATKVGTGYATALNGTAFGFDFNPVIDRIRQVSNADQNTVANPDTGAANVAATVDVFYPAGDANAGTNPNVVHSAYTNSAAGATATQLYGIDTNLDVLVTQANNTGVLGTVASLGADFAEAGGFDIAGPENTAYAALTSPGADVVSTNLFTIDLTTGDRSLLGTIGGGEIVTSLSVSNGVAAIPLPAAVLAAPLAALVAGIGHRRMKR